MLVFSAVYLFVDKAQQTPFQARYRINPCNLLSGGDCRQEVTMRQTTTFQNDVLSADGQPMSSWMHVSAMVLAGIAIISSAFHFWPFETSKAWRMLCPSNLAVLVWILLFVAYILLKRGKWADTSLFPHLSVFAYVSINVLSIAFAPSLSRAGIFTIKLTLMLLGGYVLFSSAISGTKSLRTVYGLTIAAVTIGVSYCLITRFGFGSDDFGFHSNVYKYGTYIGILTPLCGAYLVTSSGAWRKLLGVVLVVAALISSGSLGAVAAIVAGTVASVIVIRGWFPRFCIIVGLLLGIGLVILFDSNANVSLLQNDIKLAEKDGVNLKQRYIEWQAEINLLGKRTITGTAAGCINEYRSNFYYRLPKLNTLGAFDQNGWLATGAETGVLGFVCFCWILVYYFKQAFWQLTATAHRFAGVNFVGLVAACVANLFSSVHYNGILIVFVLVLVFVSRTKQLLAETVKCK